MKNLSSMLRQSSALAGEGLRMGLLSGLSFVLGFVLTSLLVEYGRLHAQTAYGIAIVICSAVNFFGYRHFVFRTRSQSFRPEAVKFIATTLLFRLVEIGIFHFLFTLMPDYRVAYIATAALGAGGKFITAKFFIFRSR